MKPVHRVLGCLPVPGAARGASSRRHRDAGHADAVRPTETASGTKADRPVLDEVLSYVRKGDTLVVWRLDRLGRSLRHLIETVALLAERGIGFKSLTEQIDTTTPGGS